MPDMVVQSPRLDRDPEQPGTQRDTLNVTVATTPCSRRTFLAHATALGLGSALLGGHAAVAAPRPRGGWQTRRTSAARFGTEGATLTVATNGSPSDLDPHSGYDYRSGLAINAAYEGLIRLKDAKTDEYEGVLAESWESNEEKSVWTFRLRDGVTFHDGSPCDAEAVRASFERLLTLGLGPVGILRRFVADPAQITTPDARTVVFDLGRPQMFFEAAMASVYGVLVANPAVLKAHEEGGDWGHTWAMVNEDGCGTGPYRIVDFEPGNQIVFERYDGYWRGWQGAHFERIVIRAVAEFETRRQLIERGEADIIDQVLPQAIADFRQNPDLHVNTGTSAEVDYFVMAIAGPLASPVARQAMCWAFPYQEVIEGVYAGFGKQAAGAVAETLRGFAPETPRYTTDLARARQLLDEAGIASGTTLTCAVETGDPFGQQAAQLFQANLRELGISLNIEQIDATTLQGIFYGDAPPEERPNFIRYGWWPDYNDAWNYLYPLMSCQSQGSAGANAGFYCNQRVEELLMQARDATSEATYQQALTEIQRIIALDDPPAVYYIQPQWLTVLRRDITGFVYNPIYLGLFDFWRMGRIAS
ncbi:MAG: ABC transporter substrate-binding protein [Chloroflexota bacterium]